jgi:hypothetical protein
VQDLRDQATLLAVTRDGGHDLIEVQIRREGAILGLLPGAGGRWRFRGQQTGKGTMACWR